MTDDEIIQKLKDSIAELGRKLPEGVNYFVGIFVDSGEDIYFGHGCPACLVEHILDWIDDQPPKHLDDNDNEVIH